MSIEMTNYIFLAIATPFAIWSAWTDLKYMKIRNLTVLLLAGAFLVSGAILLPFDVYLWRILGGVIVLVVGFALFAIGRIGGGDAKFAAAMAMFVDHAHIASFLFTLSMAALLGVFIHRMIGKMTFLNSFTDTWESWAIERKTSKKNFPLGLGMSGALIYYLLSAAAII